VFQSRFLNRLEAEAQAALDASDAAAAEAAWQKVQDSHDELLAQSHRAESYDRRLVHAWTLVKAGQRGVESDVFVEVTSARKYTPATSPYHGIEFAWNHQNFWVCMGMPEPHSDSRLHPAKAHFDWDDSAMWEPVMRKPPGPPQPEDVRGGGLVDEAVDLVAGSAAEAGGTPMRGAASAARSGATGATDTLSSVAAGGRRAGQPVGNVAQTPLRGQPSSACSGMRLYCDYDPHHGLAAACLNC
jgi:hypothetical protein